MELASMLAGEPFSDDPQSVCPVIAGFLRGYNDSVDDETRQDLYDVAAKVVGSRASSATEHARAERLQEWTGPLRGHSFWRSLIPSRSRSIVDPVRASTLGRLAGHTVRKHSRKSHETVLALVDELVAIGQPRGDVVRPPRIAGPAANHPDCAAGVETSGVRRAAAGADGGRVGCLPAAAR
jgi:hypothetical protein